MQGLRANGHQTVLCLARHSYSVFMRNAANANVARTGCVIQVQNENTLFPCHGLHQPLKDQVSASLRLRQRPEALARVPFADPDPRVEGLELLGNAGLFELGHRRLIQCRF